MRKEKESQESGSCWNRAKPEEMVFVLLGRDLAAPAAIRAWCRERIRLGKNKVDDQQIQEARSAARIMEREQMTK